MIKPLTKTRLDLQIACAHWEFPLSGHLPHPIGLQRLQLLECAAALLRSVFAEYLDNHLQWFQRVELENASPVRFLSPQLKDRADDLQTEPKTKHYKTAVSATTEWYDQTVGSGDITTNVEALILGGAEMVSSEKGCLVNRELRHNEMPLLSSMPPIVPTRPRLLILGSMPGTESLRKRQYYAHPENAFWFIMANVFAFDLNLPYLRRIQELKRNGVALWDVIKHCERQGSGDSEIRAGSEIPNDIAGLLSDHPSIKAVFFNGRKSEKVYRSRVLPEGPRIECGVYLPSTSPSYAKLSKKKKLKKWEKALRSSAGPAV